MNHHWRPAILIVLGLVLGSSAKADVRLPLFLIGCLVVLFAYRIQSSWKKRRKVSPKRDIQPANP